VEPVLKCQVMKLTWWACSPVRRPFVVFSLVSYLATLLAKTYSVLTVRGNGEGNWTGCTSWRFSIIHEFWKQIPLHWRPCGHRASLQSRERGAPSEDGAVTAVFWRVREIAIKANISFFMSVCLAAWNNSSPSGWIFVKYHTSVFFENLLRKWIFH